MRIVALSILVALAAAALPKCSAVAAEEKVVVVNLDRAFDEFYKKKLANDQLQEQADEFKKERTGLVGDLKKMQEVFNAARDEAQNTALSEDARNQKRAEAEEKLVEIREQEGKVRRYDETHQRQLDEQTRRMRKRLVEEIKAVVIAHARQQGYVAVLDSSGNSLNGVEFVVYNDPKLDITDVIIEQLNKGKPAGEAAPAAKPAAPAAKPAAK